MTMRVQEGYSVDILPKRTDPGEEILPYMLRHFPGEFTTGWFHSADWSPPATLDEEETIIAGQNTHVSSELFETMRVPFRDMFRAIITAVFEEYDIARTHGLDIGSGATGEMVHEWLPLDAEERRTWIESDADRGAVRINKKRHPDADIRHGSYLRARETLLSDGDAAVVTGLSSLDATNFLPHALAEIRNVLRDKGYLVHIQDVRPSIHVGFRQLEHEGIQSPYDALYNNHPLARKYPNPYGYCLGHETGQLKAVSTGELFRRHIGRAIMGTGGLRLLFNNWVRVARKKQEPGSSPHTYFLNIRFPNPPTIQKDTAFAVVTVARKE